MSYILRRNGIGPGLVDVPMFSKTGLVSINKDEEKLPEDAAYVFRWGTTSNIPGSPRVINKASAIHTVFDKRGFRMILNSDRLSPRSWGSMSDFFEDEYEGQILIRKNNHSRSQDIHVCETAAEISRVCEELGKDNYYISELIKKTHEYRVMFCSGRAIGVIEKLPKNKNEVSWGCVDTGNFRYINWEDWPIDVIRNALKAAELSGLDFGAVDVIHDGDRPYTLEINSSAWLSPYFCKIYTEAFDFIVKNGRDHIPVVETQNFYGYIHPSRFAGAKV